jgi:hypothetical protein
MPHLREDFLLLSDVGLCQHSDIRNGMLSGYRPQCEVVQTEPLIQY